MSGGSRPTLSVDTSLQDIGRSFEQAISGAAKNIEKSGQRFFADTALLAKGDFNNYGQSVYRNLLTLGTGGMANQNDLKKITGETTSERYKSEQVAKANDAAAAVEAAKQAEINNMVSSVISGQVTARKMSPGRAQSFLGGETKSNTLLTVMRNK